MLTKSSARGFTLIELVIVIAVVGVLVLVGAPEFRIWQANAQIRSVAEILQNDLRMAQAEAVRRNRQVALVLTDAKPVDDTGFDAADAATPVRNWAIIALPLLDGDEDDEAAGGSTGFIASHIQSDTSRTQVAGSVAAICFNSVGRLTARAEIGIADDAECTVAASNSDVTFDVTHANFAEDDTDIHRLRIQVRPGGRIRMCDRTKSSPAPDAC